MAVGGIASAPGPVAGDRLMAVGGIASAPGPAAGDRLMASTGTGQTNGVSVVIPTVGRPSLAALLAALCGQLSLLDRPVEVLIVDDRRRRAAPLPTPVEPVLALDTTTVSGPARGPAAARNAGWRAARHPWVVFLDDDVLPDPDWAATLGADLDVPDVVGGVQGRLLVPLPGDRRPTDWERGTAGLVDGKWITADMAYRRAALVAVGGFDERFPRAYREDADLAYRVRAAGWRLRRGRRRVTHPVRPEGPTVSLRVQRGNADDALLRRLYGPQWRELLDIPAGRRGRHALITGAGLLALCTAAGRGRLWSAVTAVATLGWMAGTVEFAAARIMPGPRTAREVATMAGTSVLIPPLATAYWLRGWWASAPAARCHGRAWRSRPRLARSATIAGRALDINPFRLLS